MQDCNTLLCYNETKTAFQQILIVHDLTQCNTASSN